MTIGVLQPRQGRAIPRFQVERLWACAMACHTVERNKMPGQIRVDDRRKGSRLRRAPGRRCLRQCALATADVCRRLATPEIVRGSGPERGVNSRSAFSWSISWAYATPIARCALARFGSSWSAFPQSLCLSVGRLQRPRNSIPTPPCRNRHAGIGRSKASVGLRRAFVVFNRFLPSIRCVLEKVKAPFEVFTIGLRLTVRIGSTGLTTLRSGAQCRWLLPAGVQDFPGIALVNCPPTSGCPWRPGSAAP